MWADSSSKLTASFHGNPHSVKPFSSIFSRSVSTSQHHSATQAASTAKRRCSGNQSREPTPDPDIATHPPKIGPVPFITNFVCLKWQLFPFGTVARRGDQLARPSFSSVASPPVQEYSAQPLSVGERRAGPAYEVSCGVASGMAGIFQKRGKAARPLSGSRIDRAHDRKWVEGRRAATVADVSSVQSSGVKAPAGRKRVNTAIAVASSSASLNGFVILGARSSTSSDSGSAP